MIAAKFQINGDAKGAMAALKEAQRGVHDLSKEINGGIRNTLAGAFSVEAIKELVSATIDFSEQIEKTSNRLNVTTDNVQALRLAAREAGKDLGFMEKAFTIMEKSASKALGGSGAQKKAFGNLGITEDDLKHLNKTDLLSKALRGTAGMGRGEAESNLGAVFGSKMAGGLLAIQPQLANFGQFKSDAKESGRIAGSEDIEALANLRERWLEVSDAVKTSAIPVLSWLLEKIFNFGHGVKQLVELIGTAIGAFAGSIEKFDFIGLIESFGQNLLNGFKSLFDNLWGVISGKVSISDALSNLGKTYAQAIDNSLKKGLGVNSETVHQVINEKLLSQAEEDKKIAEARNKKHQEQLDKEAKMNGDAGRTAAIKGDKAKKDHEHAIDTELKGDPAIRIGNLMNADTKYRVQRVQYEMAADVKKTAENTERTAEAVEDLLEEIQDTDFGSDGLGAGTG